MRLLAIDTALDACSVGVVNGEVTVTRSEIVGRGHAEILMGMVEAAMTEAHLSFADLDRIAVVVGPGSFTGLRVGIAAARGFALVTGKPVVGIGALTVHAEEAHTLVGTKPVLAINAAGRGDMYGAVFAGDGSEVMPAMIGSAEIFAAHVTADMVVAGSGSDLVLAALPMDHAPRIVHRRAAPDITSLCRLALRAPITGEAPRPLYLRPPDAKPQPDSSRIAHR